MRRYISTLALMAVACNFAQAQYANQTLNNLNGPTAVNQTLLPFTSGNLSLGSTAKPWKNLSLKGDIYINGYATLRVTTNKGTYLGKNAGPASLSTGLFNSAIGFTALTSTTTGGYNTALGAQALTANTTGSYNTGLGAQALIANTSGVYNTALGAQALTANTTGGSNTAVGQNALATNTIGSDNVAIGIDALNAIIGNSSRNIAIGNEAMGYANYNPAPSSDNTAVGFYSLVNGGNANTAFGWGSMANGGSNATAGTAIGYGANAGASEGYSAANTSLGYQAFSNLFGGINNVAIGENSGYTTFPTSEAIIDQHVTNNTFLGSETTIETVDLHNATAIGYQARGIADNQVVVGNSSITSIGGYANWTNFSDGRYKKNIKENVPGLEFIKQLHPVTYTLDVEGINKSAPSFSTSAPAAMPNKLKHANLPADMQAGTTKEATPFVLAKNAKAVAADAKATAEKSKIVYTGFVAQEVEAAAKKLNYDFSGVKKPANDKDYYGLRYAEFVVPLVKAVQELADKNDALTDQNNLLQSQNTQLEARLTAIEQLLAKTNGGISLNNNSLGQNIPNPSKGSTIIPFNLLAENNNASIVITEAGSGKILKTVTVNPSQKSIAVQVSNLASGTYIYSLIANGKTVDSKKMVIAR